MESNANTMNDCIYPIQLRKPVYTSYLCTCIYVYLYSHVLIHVHVCICTYVFVCSKTRYKYVSVTLPCDRSPVWYQDSSIIVWLGYRNLCNLVFWSHTCSKVMLAYVLVPLLHSFTGDSVHRILTLISFT